MNILLTILILTAKSPAPTEGAGAEAVEVFACDFETDADKNFDGWPDGWTRRRGKGYPDYVKAAIVIDKDQPRTAGASCMRIDLDGGAAALFSPPIPISNTFSYLLESALRTEKLRHSVACLSITLLDAQKKTLGTYYSEEVRQAEKWQPTKLGPILPTENAVAIVVGLHLRPTAKADLVGAALFDDVRLWRLPRIALELSAEHHLYADRTKVEAACRVMGLRNSEAQVRFELLDAAGVRLATAEQRLSLTKSKSRETEADEGYAGETTWAPPVPDWGFYRLRIILSGAADTPLERSATFAVVRPQSTGRGGQFGWSLPNGERPLTLKTLPGLLSQGGINWVKFPVWYKDTDETRAEDLARFAERLSGQGIELIGVLDHPPVEVREKFGSREELPAASVFLEPALWEPVVEPVLNRLGLKVRKWQLGADDDMSFVGFPEIVPKVTEIHKHLERFSQEIQIVVPWNAAYAPPTPKNPPWATISHSATPSFTDAELSQYLALTPTPGVKRWVMLEPLARSQYSALTRAHDLVARMLAAKTQRADAVFIPNPFDAEHGLLGPDGAPEELFVPWRITAHMLSGADYLGSISLPQGSRNYVFEKNGEAVLVVWNEKPTRETLYLGDDVRQTDIWGREITPHSAGHEQEIEVTQSPTFISGVNLAIAKWRMALAFDKRELESVFGRDQQVGFRFKNTFEQGIGGECTLVTPHVWETTPGKFHFKSAAGEELQQKLLVLLKPDANTGDQNVRLDFDLTADRRYKFSVYQTLRVGLGDITLDVSTRLDEEGTLTVEQHLTNATDRPVSFNFFLFAPGQRRQRTQVFEQGRGRNSKTYILPNATELLGQTIWLRAEEMNGPRILNYRLTVER